MSTRHPTEPEGLAGRAGHLQRLALLGEALAGEGRRP